MKVYEVIAYPPAGCREPTFFEKDVPRYGKGERRGLFSTHERAEQYIKLHATVTFVPHSDDGDIWTMRSPEDPEQEIVSFHFYRWAIEEVEVDAQ